MKQEVIGLLYVMPGWWLLLCIAAIIFGICEVISRLVGLSDEKLAAKARADAYRKAREAVRKFDSSAIRNLR